MMKWYIQSLEKSGKFIPQKSSKFENLDKKLEKFETFKKKIVEQYSYYKAKKFEISVLENLILSS